MKSWGRETLNTFDLAGDGKAGKRDTRFKNSEIV
jgi:hypothetical protein